jgi:hypothetical protein
VETGLIYFVCSVVVCVVICILREISVVLDVVSKSLLVSGIANIAKF